MAFVQQQVQQAKTMMVAANKMSQAANKIGQAAKEMAKQMAASALNNIHTAEQRMQPIQGGQ